MNKFVSCFAFFSLSVLTSGVAMANELSLDEAYKLLEPVVRPASMMAEPEQNINGESCYTIAVGDNSSEQFVVTSRYAVCKVSGKIYSYDIISDSYTKIKVEKK